jgi:hypothetical protein
MSAPRHPGRHREQVHTNRPVITASGSTRPSRPGHRATRSTRRRLAATAGVLIATICIGGMALAYWRTSGTGSGAATTGVAVAVTLSPGTPALTLYPGGAADVTLIVSNANRTAVLVGSLVLDPTQGTSGFGVDAAHSACATSALSFTTQTNGGAGWLVPAKTGITNGALAIDLPDSLTMNVGAVDACQGAQFAVYLVAGS